MTAGDARALALLCSQPGLIRTGAFGEYLWAGRDRRAGNCSCPWARPAAKVLNRLSRAGLAEFVVRDRGYWGWRATQAGYSVNSVGAS